MSGRPINIAGGLYSRAWAYASVGELARIFVVVVVGSIVGIVFFYLILVPLGVGGTEHRSGGFLARSSCSKAFSRSPGWVAFGSSFAHRPSGKAGDRGLRTGTRAGDADGAGPVPTLVYGAGDVGATVLRTIGAASDGLGMRVVGLLDDDAPSGTRCCGAARSSAA